MSSSTAPAPAEVQVVFVEDDEDVRMGSAQALELAGLTVHEFGSVEQARAQVPPGAPLVVLCDVNLPGTSGTEWLRELQALDADLPVILVTGRGDIAMAVQAMRQGAYDFIEKPFASEHLVNVVRRAIEKRSLQLQLRALHAQMNDWQGIQALLIGRSAAMQRLRRQLLTLAATDVDVLIYGETGTGKDLVARCLHEHSERRRARYVAVNCGGLPEALADSELFGAEPGAYTGATRLRVGKLEHADGGTLFLDEIESMPMAVQVKLLRVLQERKLERLGGNREIDIRLRVIAASKADLKVASDAGRFRADLYYRIGVAFLTLPPLRERREDIALLFEHFVLQAASRYGVQPPALSASQLAELVAHAWPGNVRELRNVAERFALGLLEDLPMVGGDATAAATLPQQMEQFERALIVDALRRHHGEAVAAARALGVAKQTLYDKLKRLRLATDEFRSDDPG
jgi:two-component system C4-dicarboxylate transport response regulator DctD